MIETVWSRLSAQTNGGGRGIGQVQVLVQVQAEGLTFPLLFNS